jgi:hypothetical protein
MKKGLERLPAAAMERPGASVPSCKCDVNPLLGTSPGGLAEEGI